MARRKGGEFDTRAALLDAAWELFAREGSARASVEAIVARAGLSKGTFFHYFASKHDLLEAVCGRVVDASFTQLAHELETPRRASAVSRLNRLLGAMRQWRLAHAGVLADVWRSVAGEHDGLLRSRLAELANARMLPLLVKIVQQGKAEGAFEVDDAAEASRFVIAVLGSAGIANLELLSGGAGGEGEGVAAAIARRSDAASTAIERLLGAPAGTVERMNARAVRRLLRDAAPAPHPVEPPPVE